MEEKCSKTDSCLHIELVQPQWYLLL